MIRSFRHSGLKRLRDRNDASRVLSTHASKIRSILLALENASVPGDLNGVAGLHPLHGDRVGSWSLWVSAKWRIKFRFQDGDVWEVDLVDYHLVAVDSELMSDPPHPGTVIRDLWMDGMSIESVAKRLDVSRTELQRLVEGKREISPALALKMAAAGWSTALFWVRLQAYYDLAQEYARQQRAA